MEGGRKEGKKEGRREETHHRRISAICIISPVTLGAQKQFIKNVCAEVNIS